MLCDEAEQHSLECLATADAGHRQIGTIACSVLSQSVLAYRNNESGGKRAVDSYLDTFKKYVPSEILAAFITINSLVPYQAPLDLYLITASVAALTILFIVVGWSMDRFKSKVKLFTVAATLPFWCFSISSVRMDNYLDTDSLRIIVSVVLVIVSVALTLTAGKSAIVSVDNTVPKPGEG